MKWFVVVLFATSQGDVYIFNKPSFETREECVATLYNPEKINAYLAKILIEYGRPMPIRLANCLQGDTIEQILNETKKKSRI